MSNPLSKIIYLDHAATTPLDPEVAQVMSAAFAENYGNPSSLHKVGRLAHDALELARTKVANTLGVLPQEIIFTGSGTESDNLAILGLARARRQHGRHVVVSALEHKAVLAASRVLEKEGFTISYIQPNPDGLISVKSVISAITPETILVSIMYANNEIGTIQPIANISRDIRDTYPEQTNLVIHTDACQAPGMLPVSPLSLGVTALTLNSAKVYGPKGIGILYLKAGTTIEPLIVGGDQESGLRAGTESVPLAIGCALALEKAVFTSTEESARLRKLQKFFIEELRNRLPEAILNGHETVRLPNNVHICIPDIEGESLVLLLDEANICCSTGSACSSLDLEPSHVLRAIGRSDEIIHGSLRFSFGRSTTKDDLIYTITKLVEVVAKLKTMTATTTKAITKTYVSNA